MIDDDERFMGAAIALARRGLGLAAPNPAVGSLIVREGVIIGRGWTKPGGRPHAETEALREAGARAAGATLYVTLEPCSHHGQTAPCAEAIVNAGVARVVSAIGDPDPRVAGRGHQLLREAGIDLRLEVCAEPALRANLGHMLRVRNRRPMVTLKLALTADGFAGGLSGKPRLLISAAAANGYVHIQRAMHDAVMVGVGTALVDDPLLTVRLAGLEKRKPLRVVLDSDLRLSPQMRLAQTASDHPTLVIAGENASVRAEARLAAADIKVARVRRDERGRVDLGAGLALLAERGVTRVLCEGGPTLADALIAQELADEIILLTSATALARPGIPGLNAESLKALADPARYKSAESRRIGADSLVRSARIL